MTENSLQPQKNDKKKSNAMKTFSIRLDQKTVNYIESFSDIISYQSGAPKNFSNTIRFLILHGGNNKKLQSQFVKLTPQERNYLDNSISHLTDSLAEITTSEQGVGNNMNQLAYESHVNNLPPTVLEKLSEIEKTHDGILLYLKKLNTNLRNLNLTLRASQIAEWGEEDARNSDN